MSMFSLWARRTLANPDTKKNLTPTCVKYSSGALINEVSESGRGNQDAIHPNRKSSRDEPDSPAGDVSHSVEKNGFAVPVD